MLPYRTLILFELNSSIIPIMYVVNSKKSKTKKEVKVLSTCFCLTRFNHGHFKMKKDQYFIYDLVCFAYKINILLNTNELFDTDRE